MDRDAVLVAFDVVVAHALNVAGFVKFEELTPEFAWTDPSVLVEAGYSESEANKLFGLMAADGLVEFAGNGSWVILL